MAYNDWILEARNEAVVGGDSVRAQTIQTVRDQYAGVVEAVAGSSNPLEALDQGLQEFEAGAQAAITEAQDEVIALEEEAHGNAYAEAATASAPNWTPAADPNRRFGSVRGLVRGSISRGVSFMEQDLQYIREYVDDRRFAQAVAQVLTKGREGIAQKLLDRGLDLDLDLSEINPRAPQILQNINRTAATEISAVMDETSKELMAKSPAVELVKWSLSSSHSGRFVPDACDVFATQDLHGFGNGLYHPETVPSQPHPHCKCSVVAELRPPSEWSTENISRPDKPELETESVKDVLKDIPGERTVTDAFAENQAQDMQAAINFAESNPRGL